jgi:hypothetical protein
MAGRPKKHHVVAATLTTVVGTAALVAALRGSGGADTGTVRFTQVVDRCGNVVLTDTGEPYLFRIELEPPLEGSAADPSEIIETTTPEEDELVGVPIPADPRAISRAQLSCDAS